MTERQPSDSELVNLWRKVIDLARGPVKVEAFATGAAGNVGDARAVYVMVPDLEALRHDPVLRRLGADDAFSRWVATLPKAHWARYDLSACALGWNAALDAVEACTKAQGNG